MAGFSLFLALVVGVVVWLTLHDDTYTAPAAPVRVARADPAEAAGAVRRLEGAVRTRDAARVAGLGADPRAQHLLDDVVRNARDLRVADFALRYVDEAGGVSADGTWPAYVDAAWRFAGFDARTIHLEVEMRFRDVDGSARLVGIGGGDRRSPLWLTAPVRVRRTARTLVLVDGPSSEAARYAVLARRAVPTVDRVLPDWHGKLVLEVPATADGLARELDAGPDEYAGIAAVTTTVSGSSSRRAPVHVFANPQIFADLREQGAQIVLSHETTHVATGAATSSVPLWLLEGFGDYVALRDTTLPLRRTAGQIMREVRRHGVPSTLPGPAQFDSRAKYLGATYESAWLACRLLARTGGEHALVSLYRAVDRGGALAPAMRARFGFGPAELTRRWQALLAHWKA